ncbi:glycosyltransferase family 2 protein [Inconstantimicrobium porci]|uniref:Glycosyltransferase n=1 Tax=Inconstantimicrobium porci TaxID=2652291 RepID=A0A7X2MY39_9CLOT|nr:glycosyltransferase [Inconstantimicrobium porci]MSR91206.1 glycosyltransferase [Inconstantimicrobium porci]
MDKEELLLSIIIPVYNVEKYLRQCIESVVKQNLYNYEIILVNDGSTDNSLNICKEYADKYTEIKIIDQKNKGLGAARNAGIKKASGKYIGFLDSDDYIKQDMFSKMLNKAEEDNLDLVICAVEMYFEDDGRINVIENHINHNLIYNKMDIIRYVLTRNVQCFAWNKIYRRSLFYNLGYEENVYYEDIFTMYKVAQMTNKWTIINDPLYVYRQRKNNITSTVTLKHINDLNFEIEKVHDDIKLCTYIDPKLDMSFIISYLNVSLDLFFKYCKYDSSSIYKNYQKVYGNIPKYRVSEIIFNKYIQRRFKINYLLFKMRILPILKKLKNKS